MNLYIINIKQYHQKGKIFLLCTDPFVTESHTPNNKNKETHAIANWFKIIFARILKLSAQTRYTYVKS